MKNIKHLLLITTLLCVSGCTTIEEPINQSNTNEEAKIESSDYFKNEIVMENVSSYKPTQGTGYYDTREDETRIYAAFVLEPINTEEFFYEGWLVCNNKPYSTGALISQNGIDENIFVSSEVPTNCQKYVLTIEPNDNDPAPADHILDGTFKSISPSASSLKWDNSRFQI
jgi:hypothetical protein